MSIVGGLKKGNSDGKKSVDFHHSVRVIEFPMILCDNPSCSSSGPPVCMDWEPQSERTINLNLYEQHLRSCYRRRKRPCLKSDQRMKLVLAASHSKEEISASILAVILAQKLRAESLEDNGDGCQVTVTMIGRDWLVIVDRLVLLLQSYPLLLLLFQRLTIHKVSMLFSLSKVKVPQYDQNMIIEFS
jgi:hypothetical protein